ncbi:MAG: amidophosphoribosyltransferase [Chloroflexi bacterium]|nr:amidophosphoribosyltransferase [Chloroflexota bacterium]|tara:strand:- start:13991 stop:15379 length:1389 start_codon:yes stop_codon:yes gene_type:complete
MKEACGVVGVFSPGQQASRAAFFGIHALQHRGQESAGIAASSGTNIQVKTQMGLVTQVFQEKDLSDLDGYIALGHTRYSTTGSSHIDNAQPFLSKSDSVEIALGHNGNLINALELRNELLDLGVNFQSSADSEIIAHLISHAPASSWAERISYAMRKLNGAYSLGIMTNEEIIGVRDPLGVRPLCIGTLDDGWVIASESCALDHLGAEFYREVLPGEAVLVNKDGLKSIYQKPNSDHVLGNCIFEQIYFSRPDSLLNGDLVYTSRMNMGAQLAKEFPVDADVVIGVPDSATAAAVGYSQQSGIPFTEGLVKNRYVGRTFIFPDQRLRELGVRRKFNLLPQILKDKKVVVVDDSIVRGTTTPHIVDLLRKGGAKEIHLRICAPPIISPCHFGVDMAKKSELIASNMTVEEITEHLKVDSLGFLSNNGLLKSISGERDQYCMGCFTGNYPIPIQLEMDKLVLES